MLSQQEKPSHYPLCRVIANISIHIMILQSSYPTQLIYISNPESNSFEEVYKKPVLVYIINANTQKWLDPVNIEKS